MKDFGIGVRIVMDGNNRNKNCPCGSGVKFKKCHGKNTDSVILGDVPKEKITNIIDTKYKGKR